MRPRGFVAASTVVGLILSSACSPESVPDVEPGGVPVVRPAVDGRPLARHEVLRIGDVEGGEASFYRVTGLALDTNGALYVLETNGIRVFDSDGTLLCRFGREGQGPGEFRAAQTLQVVGDTVVVGDMDNRLHFFATDGTHIRTRVYRELLGDGWRTYFTIGTPDGWLLQASKSDWGGWEPGQPAPEHPPTEHLELHWLDPDGDLQPSGFQWETSLRGRWYSSDGLSFLQAPYTHALRWAVDGLGRAHVAATEDYVLDVYGPDGSTLHRLEVDVPRIPIDDALRERWLEAVCWYDGPCVSEQSISLPGPEHLPVVGTIWGFVAGHIAVRRADTKAEPADFRIADFRAGGVWDVFDPEGMFLGTLPATVTPRWFDGETLLTIERGALDEEQVVRYRVQRPDPSAG